MAESGSVLSQDAIDALLNSAPVDAPAPSPDPAPPDEPEADLPMEDLGDEDEQPDEAEIRAAPPEPGPTVEAVSAAQAIAATAAAATPPPQEPAVPAEPAPPAPVAQPAAPPPPPPPQPAPLAQAGAQPAAAPTTGGPDPNTATPAAAPPGPSLDRDAIAALTAQAAAAAFAPFQADLEALSERIQAIERGIEQLSDHPEHGGGEDGDSEAGRRVDPAIERRIASLEKGAKASPTFGLYNKLTCPDCGTSGAAQVKARCGHCGREGWFGRKEPPKKPE